VIYSKLSGIKIKGIAGAVPSQKRQTSDFYEAFGEIQVNKFEKMAGIKERRISRPEQTASDLGYKAAEALLAKHPGISAEIGALLFVSQTPDYRLPSTACVLHKRLGFREDCIAFDVNLGCSAYVYGIQILSSLMSSFDFQYGLLVVADTFTKCVSPVDRTSAMLFGDAGTATLLQKSDALNSISSSLYTKGEGYQAILTSAGGYRKPEADAQRKTLEEGVARSDFDAAMNGLEVFNFSIIDVPKAIAAFLKAEQKTADDYDQIILHQANMYMLEQISKKAKLPIGKVAISLDKYGNTSGASIPISLVDKYGGASGFEANVLMCGFGVGLSWGVMNAQIEVNGILPIIETDEFFIDMGANIKK
jgi:3-oxoacyl-[acyl-carrier-protein] synthase-3